MTNLPPAESTGSHEVSHADFEVYRQICDQQGGSFRKIGILEEEAYQAALQDTRTQLIDGPEGSLPLFVHSDWVSGYDVPRTKKLTGKEDIFLLGVPANMITQPIEVNRDIKDAAILVETGEEDTERVKDNLVQQFSSADMAAHDFIDDRLTDEYPEHATAWIGLYEATIIPDIEPDPKVPHGDIKAAFSRLTGGDLRPREGDALYDAQAYEAHPEILEKLWDLFQERFSWLGDNHPVSMEDTRVMFEGLVLSEGAFSTLHFVDDELVCAGLFIDKAVDCDWLSPATNQAMRVRAEKNEATPVYYAGIAARGANNHYMEGLVKFYCNLRALAGVKDNLYIESSNMSSIYIPKTVQDYVDATNSSHLENGMEQTARQDYWYLAA